MKKLDGSIIAALILVAGMLATVSVYVFFSPTQTCIRAYKEIPALADGAERICTE